MFNLRTLSLTLLIGLVVSVSAQAAHKVTCYTNWDDRYLYVGFEVQDPDVVSTNTTHMSEPWMDDDVEVYVETDHKQSTGWSPNTYEMAVSAGGGSSFLGGEAGNPVTRKIYTFKSAAKVQGTVNRSSDVDNGYVVELAMPWKEMGGVPQSGSVLGFNAVCRMKNENADFVSLSPEVKTEEDIKSPAKWTSIKLVNGTESSSDGMAICRAVSDNAPLIDGKLGPGEWNRDTSFYMVKPEPVGQTQVQKRYSIEKLALATYCFPQDAKAGQTDPAPWFRPGSVQWHKNQLLGMKNAGIDVALVSAKPDAQNMANMDQALKELDADGLSYPVIAPRIDVSSLSKDAGDAKDLIYRSIEDFYKSIPEPYRAAVQYPMEKGGRPACIVDIYGDSGSFDEAAVRQYADAKFSEEFGGRDLIWIGEQHSGRTALDGYTTPGAQLGKGIQSNDTGWIRIAEISPRTDAQSRMDPDTYKNAWNDLLSKPSDWVIVHSWNDISAGTEICSTIEQGERYADITKMNLIRFNGMRPFDAKYLGHDTPSVMLPGDLYQVTLTIKNVSMKPWYTSDAIFIAGRWYKDGSLYADSGARLPIQHSVLAGQVIRKTIGIRTVDQDGKPLPAGDYELRWEMMHGRDEWFANLGDTPLSVPVTIGTPTAGFTVVDSTLPTLVESGGNYQISAKIRNDGLSVWKANTTKIALCSGETQGTSEVTLASDVDPGRIAEVTIPINVPSGSTACTLKWKLDSEGKPVENPNSELATIIRADYGAKLTSADTYFRVQPGKKLDLSFAVENTGVDTWASKEFSIQCRWYDWNGKLVGGDAQNIHLPSDVRSGQRVDVKSSVTAPSEAGRYYMVLGLAHENAWASDDLNVRSGDLLVTPVNVTKGK